VHVCRRPRDGLSFSSFVRELLGRARRGVIRYRDVILDYERFQYLLGPDEVAQSLPLKEAQLLRLLLEQPGVCLSRETISANLWDGLKITPRTIDSHVSRLRKRLLGAEVSIESVYGGGYVLK
jgi:DNA-binding response OmpR family regulator